MLGVQHPEALAAGQQVSVMIVEPKFLSCRLCKNVCDLLQNLLPLRAKTSKPSGWGLLSATLMLETYNG